MADSEANNQPINDQGISIKTEIEEINGDSLVEITQKEVTEAVAATEKDDTKNSNITTDMSEIAEAGKTEIIPENKTEKESGTEIIDDTQNSNLTTESATNMPETPEVGKAEIIPESKTEKKESETETTEKVLGIAEKGKLISNNRCYYCSIYLLPIIFLCV